MSDDTMRDDMYDGSDPSEAKRESLPPGCAAFDDALADYLDGTLDAAARSRMDAHRAGCARCAALLADLENISAAARALPAIVPTAATAEAMWRGVSERIAAPTRSIDSAPSVRRVRFDGWRRQLAAAAALVLVTAGVTYSVTHVVEGGRGRVDVSSAVVGPASPLQAPTPPVVAPIGPVVQGGDSASDSAGSRGPQLGGGQVVPVKRAPKAGVSRPSVTDTYEREIRGLGRILDERRGELDSATVVVLEKNLAVIDQAIRQSREALARDPRSRFLDQQLNSALDKKVELLRTAALLPSRT